MSAQRVNVVFGADAGPLRSGVNQAKASLEGLKKTAGGLAGMVAGAVSIGAIKAFGDEIGRLDDLAQRFGTSIEEIQRLGFIALKNGTDIEAMAAALQRATVNAQKAKDGSKELSKQFEALSINVDAFLAASPTDRLVMLADGFNNASSEGKAFEAVIAVAGKAAGELVPTFRTGGEAIRELGDSIAVVSKENADAVNEMMDAWERFATSVKAPLAGLLATLLKIGQTVAEVTKGAGIATGEFVGFAIQAGKALVTADKDGLSGAFENYLNAAGDARDEMEANVANIWKPQAKGGADSDMPDPFKNGMYPKGSGYDPFQWEGAGEEYGPANEAGIAENKRLAAAKRYYQYLESKKAVTEGIAAIDEQIAGTNPFTNQVAGDLTSRGYGGNVYGGGANPELKELQAQKAFLQDQLKTLQKIEGNTKGGNGMLP
jgi:hypothetical protein